MRGRTRTLTLPLPLTSTLTLTLTLTRLGQCEGEAVAPFGCPLVRGLALPAALWQAHPYLLGLTLTLTLTLGLPLPLTLPLTLTLPLAGAPLPAGPQRDPPPRLAAARH